MKNLVENMTLSFSKFPYMVLTTIKKYFLNENVLKIMLN